MSEPFLSEIRIMSFTFAPQGWALCNGQLMPINQNFALFSLLGTTYGGDGRVTFGLPNLQGRTPIHMGNGHTLGEIGGEQSHTLTIAEMPSHSHAVNVVQQPAAHVAPDTNAMPQQMLGRATTPVYKPLQQPTSVSPGQIGSVGGSQPHPNMQPYLVLGFCIALSGIYPSPN